MTKKISRLSDASVLQSQSYNDQNTNNEMFEKDSEIERIEKSALEEELEDAEESQPNNRLKPVKISFLDEYDSEYENTNIVSQIEEKAAPHRQFKRVEENTESLRENIKNSKSNQTKNINNPNIERQQQIQRNQEQIVRSKNSKRPQRQKSAPREVELSSNSSSSFVESQVHNISHPKTTSKVSSSTSLNRTKPASSTSNFITVSNDSELLSRKRNSQQRKYSYLPVARAFEGSTESEQDLDTLSQLEDEREIASENFVRNEIHNQASQNEPRKKNNFKEHDRIISHRHNKSEHRQTNRKDLEHNSNKKTRRDLARIEKIVEEDSASQITESTEESVVERPKMVSNKTINPKNKSKNQK